MEPKVPLRRSGDRCCEGLLDSAWLGALQFPFNEPGVPL